MQAQTLPAAAGWRWIGAGFAIFRRNPPMLSMLVVSYWLTVLVLNVLPVIGALAASLVIPGLSVGLMQAARDLERGRSIGLPTLFGGLQRNTRTLLALGALYLAATIAVLALSALVDGGELLRFMLATKAVDRKEIEDANFLRSFGRHWILRLGHACGLVEVSGEVMFAFDEDGVVVVPRGA